MLRLVELEIAVNGRAFLSPINRSLLFFDCEYLS